MSRTLVVSPQLGPHARRAAMSSDLAVEIDPRLPPGDWYLRSDPCQRRWVVAVLVLSCWLALGLLLGGCQIAPGPPSVVTDLGPFASMGGFGVIGWLLWKTNSELRQVAERAVATAAIAERAITEHNADQVAIRKALERSNEVLERLRQVLERCPMAACPIPAASAK